MLLMMVLSSSHAAALIADFSVEVDDEVIFKNRSTTDDAGEVWGEWEYEKYVVTEIVDENGRTIVYADYYVSDDEGDNWELQTEDYTMGNASDPVDAETIMNDVVPKGTKIGLYASQVKTELENMGMTNVVVTSIEEDTGLAISYEYMGLYSFDGEVIVDPDTGLMLETTGTTTIAGVGYDTIIKSERKQVIENDDEEDGGFLDMIKNIPGYDVAIVCIVCLGSIGIILRRRMH